MSDVNGVTEGLGALFRLAPGRQAGLRAVLAALPTGPGSPFAAVPGTFLARLGVVAPPRRRAGGPAPAPCLLLAVDVDAPADAWLRALCARAAGALDPVFAHCVGYPGMADAEAFAAWVAAGRLPIGFSVIGAPQARVAEVGAALALRRRLGALAAAWHGHDDTALRAAWSAEFGS